MRCPTMPLLPLLTDSTLHIIEEWLHHVAHHVQGQRCTHTDTGAPAKGRKKIWGSANESNKYSTNGNTLVWQKYCTYGRGLAATYPTKYTPLAPSMLRKEQQCPRSFCASQGTAIPSPFLCCARNSNPLAQPPRSFCASQGTAIPLTPSMLLKEQQSQGTTVPSLLLCFARNSNAAHDGCDGRRTHWQGHINTAWEKE